MPRRFDLVSLLLDVNCLNMQHLICAIPLISIIHFLSFSTSLFFVLALISGIHASGFYNPSILVFALTSNIHDSVFYNTSIVALALISIIHFPASPLPHFYFQISMFWASPLHHFLSLSSSQPSNFRATPFPRLLFCSHFKYPRFGLPLFIIFCVFALLSTIHFFGLLHSIAHYPCHPYNLPFSVDFNSIFSCLQL